MGESIDRVAKSFFKRGSLTKLTRVVVGPHVRVRDGKRENVEGYTYERAGSGAVPTPATTRIAKPKPAGVKPPGAPPGTPKQRRKPKELGTKAHPIVTDNVEVAARALAEGKHVELKQAREVSTLVHRLRQIVEDAKAKGEKAPTYDLCKVTVANTNLFCVDSKGIPRVKMPQLGGIPKPGSKADDPKYERNKAGEVDLSEEFAQYLVSKGYEVADEKIDADKLRATQNELGGAQVAAIASSMEEKGIDPKRAWLWVSDSDYVIDGHHRWAAMVAVGLGKGKPVEVPIHHIKVDIITALDLAREFAQDMGIAEATLTSKVAELARRVEGCGCS